MKRIACVGEVMLELVTGANSSATLGVAGDTYNTAVYMARSLRGSGVSVSYVTALGTDPYSEQILNEIRIHGLGTECIERREDAIPGLYAIKTDDAGERSFSYWRSASAARTLFSAPCDIDLARLNDFDLILLSGISMAILPQAIREQLMAWLDTFKTAGGTFAYDSNHRPRLWDNMAEARRVNDAMWARADIALPSVDDEMELYGDTSAKAVVTRLRALGCTQGALKRGSAGPLGLSNSTELASLPTVDKVVDSTAAGDSFNAGFLAATALGETEDEAMFAGHKLASKVITMRGAIIPE
ncbi:MAG: sugar kinase [Rhodobacteraceae bacterium]|nr:sugar kinase [Paracoccaceae bacterium]